jgi:hypothetical protein
MTKFKDTIFGKILKGAAIAGGSILGLGAVVGGVSGIVKGTGALAGIAKGVGAIKPIANKLSQSAVNLVTGTTKDERAQINAVKADTKAAADKLEQVQRLINAGSTPAAARAIVGIPEGELTAIEGAPIQSAGLFDFGNPVIKYGLIGVGLFFLAKILKIIK